jgi:hypothetical protein
MTPTGFFFRLPITIIFLVVLGAMFATVALGRRMGERDRKDCDDDSRTHATGLQAAVLGLLALLLGFTFSAAALRYDSNRDIVVAEANAIKTAYLRADLAVEPERTALRAILERYVDLRVAFYQVGVDARQRASVDAESERLQARMWAQAMTSAARSTSYSMPLLVDSVNKVIAFHETRLDAARNHVPPEILWLLVIMAPATTGLTGYVAGFGNRRLQAPTSIVLVLIALVIGVIVDLDRPMHGFIRGGQDAMLDLERSLQRMPLSLS